jgi:uncharacterized membrane protein HdeD (DUF308 family)
MTTIRVNYERETASLGGWWWLLLVTGIIWIIIGIFALEADFDSAVLIGYLVAVWLIFAGVAEFATIGAVEGWKWLHAVLGVLFVLGGIGALLAPFQTFTVLAGLMGFFLVIKGTFDFALALLVRGVSDLWWLTLILAVLEVVLGIWAMGYPGRSATLLIIWVGVGAIVRGVSDIVNAFAARRGSEWAVAA